MNVPAPPTPATKPAASCGCAERPELLITETLALHDRRTEDLASNDTNGHDVRRHEHDTLLKTTIWIKVCGHAGRCLSK